MQYDSNASKGPNKYLNICLNICLLGIMSKTITIKNTVYDKLIKIKKGGESFSALFSRLMEEERSIEVLTRLRGSVEFKDKAKILAEIRTKRAERRR